MPEASAQTVSGTVLAFDFGEKRIGVAVGEWLLRRAHPLTVIERQNDAQGLARIAALIDEWQPVSLVVGRPVALDGSAHALTARCERFARRLRERFRLAVAFADERLTSCEAQERLRAAGHNARQARKHIDSVAAQIILQNHFDAAAGDLSQPQGCQTHVPS
ncbi:MAG: Holliday junction resolvase RuvX [Candidatus Accumulibacter sp.]|uniref:Holliday junction resolvase RuvX n=1 Tax=Accumulibacter sp. TaxID=2053492 RepID=UPI0028792264|nr:Holliday junction resolvase RuvX [Accumulibacter sp.]MDS4012775.1 Holliday junction resolvase RuvX [Accumulibacter sp.]